MSMVPQDIDNRPDQPTAETPNTGAAPPSGGGTQPAVPAPVPNEASPSIAPTGDPTRRRRRRRRRHRRPPADAAGANGTTAAGAGSPTAPEASAQPAPGDSSAAAPGGPTAPGQAPGGEGRRRRRRHRRPRSDSAAQAAGTNPSLATADAIAEPRPGQDAQRPRGDRPPRHRRGHRGTQRDEREREERRRDQRGASTGDNREGRARDPRRSHQKDEARGPKHRRQGRERGDVRRKPEPKLYRLESIVDRGFEDVADPATEGATRRVDWIIVKRTTADQRTARALSAVYVLRRDGNDTEFAHLSAARAAVHKTIAHPEKLTLSKADHAAAKAGKK
jgi:hypothetical protein